MYDVYEGKENRQKIVFDEIYGNELERFARHLASLHIAEIEEGGEIPNTITFFDMLGIDRIVMSGRLRQEDCEFYASMGYIARPCLNKIGF